MAHHNPQECRICREYYSDLMDQLKYIKNEPLRERLEKLFDKLWDEKCLDFDILWNEFGAFLRDL